MRTALAACLALVFTLSAGRAAAQESRWELVLLKPADCAGCALVEEMLRRRGFVQTAELSSRDGTTIAARVVRRQSSDLDAEEQAALAALPWFDATTWESQRAQRAPQVLLKRDGRVVSGGSLTDTADLRRVRLPESVMAPTEGIDLVTARREHDQTWWQLTMRHWNFDWFYELALDPAMRRPRGFVSLLAEAAARPLPAVGERNLVLQATASWPGDNEIFNASRIGEIRDVASRRLGVDAGAVTVLYGGSHVAAADATAVTPRGLVLARQPVQGSRPATADNLASLFEALRARGATRNLFVFVGHGSPEGAGLWSHVTPLSPDDLATLHTHGGGDDVLVSGNCYGGVMARAMSCGFFAARPDIVATGCQADAAQVAQSRDYLKMFFGSLEADELRRADADRDGSISFEEAHWFATAYGDLRNITYTTLDALADEWFEANPAALPARMSVAELRSLGARARPVEAEAVKRLTDGLLPEYEFETGDLAGQAARWTREQAGIRPMLAQLARRLRFLEGAGGKDTEVSRVRACESRGIAEFLAGAPSG